MYTAAEVLAMSPEEHEEAKAVIYREATKGFLEYMAAKVSIYMLIWYVARYFNKKVK